MNTADKRPTTTISTIAIQAGTSSTIVVAVIKSAQYVQLRIDQMRPKMLEIGRSGAESRQLLVIHNDLMERLRNKQDQIEELLAQADHLVTEQKEPEVAVYEAMADSLGSAWKELNRQLQLRGNLLEETVKFYELADQHDKFADRLGRQIGSTSKIDQQYIAQMQQLRNDLIDVTAYAMDAGSWIIAQTRLLGSMADNPERLTEIVDTCLLIENVMLRLAGQWERVQLTCDEQQRRLDVDTVAAPAPVTSVFDVELDAIERWLIDARNRMNLVDAGEFAEHSSTELDHIVNEAKQHQSKLRHMAESGSIDASMHNRIDALRGQIDEFVRHIDRRQKIASDVAQFFSSANALLHQLDSMANDITNANAAMAGELGPLARQKTEPVIDRGRSLLRLLGDNAIWSSSIDQTTRELERKLNAVEALSRSRSQEMNDQLRIQVTSVRDWLHDVAESFMKSNSHLGSTYAQANEFLARHKQFAVEVTNKEPDVVTVLNKSRDMTQSDRNIVGEFHQRYEQLKQKLESRIQLSSLYNQFHKFSKELDCSFDSLDSLLKTNRDFSEQRIAAQMSQVFCMIQETLTQEKHYADKFIANAQSISKTDIDLRVSDAIDTVRSVVVAHDRRFASIQTSWQGWQKTRTDSKRVENVIEEIEVWIKESWEIIRTLENDTQMVKTIEDAERLVTKVETLKQQQQIQEEKMSILEESSHQLDLTEYRQKLDEAKRKYKEIIDRMYSLERKIVTMRETITREVHRIEQLEQKHGSGDAPKITTPLHDCQVDEGERFSFSARISTEIEPKIRWLKDGIDVRKNADYLTTFQNGVASLTIEETFIEDSAIYTIVVESPIGRDESSARLIVKSRSQQQSEPKFIKQPQNVFVNEGQSAAVDCVVVGHPEPQVTWYREDEPLKETTNLKMVTFHGEHCTLNIRNSTQYDSGLYKVVARNSMGEAITYCRITVQAPPQPKPPAATVIPPALSTQIIEIRQTTESHTPPPPPVPKHQYQQSTHMFEEYMEKDVQELGISKTATAPEFIRKFQTEYTAREGESVRIEALLVGNPRPKVYWLFNDRPMAPSSGSCQLSNVGDTYSIVLSHVQRIHQGTYRMIAENIRGRTECTTWLSVLPAGAKLAPSPRPSSTSQHHHRHENELELIENEQRAITPHKRARVNGNPPHFSQTLVSIVVVEGDTATFEAQVTGQPEPEIQWTHDGRAISPATDPQLKFSMINGRVSLEFPTVRAAFAGKYMCTARNVCGIATSSAQLVVRLKTIAPDFSQRLISREVMEGESLRWEVRVSGDPKPSVSWLRDGQPIPHCDEVQLLDEPNGRHVLYIIKVEPADCGQFTCLAENAAGEARSTADLVVRPIGTEPGAYFHVTKVTQEKQVKGQEVSRNQAFAIEEPPIVRNEI